MPRNEISTSHFRRNKSLWILRHPPSSACPMFVAKEIFSLDQDCGHLNLIWSSTAFVFFTVFILLFSGISLSNGGAHASVETKRKSGASRAVMEARIERREADSKTQDHGELVSKKLSRSFSFWIAPSSGLPNSFVCIVFAYAWVQESPSLSKHSPTL